MQLQTLVGNLSCLLFGVKHMEGVACGRSTVETKDDGWFGRRCVVDALVALVEHGLDASVTGTGNDVVAHTQCTVAHQNGGNVATTLVERRFDDATRSLAVGVGLQVEHFSFKEHFLQQVVNAYALLGTDFLTLVFTSPFFYQKVHVGKVFTYFVGVGTRFVYLVDGKHHRHVGSLCMGNGLTGGGHHAVVGCNDDDGDIGDLGTAGTHGGKCLVTGSVEEGDLSAVAQCHVVGTDMLGDATSLAGNHVGVADVVEQ